LHKIINLKKLKDAEALVKVPAMPFIPFFKINIGGCFSPQKWYLEEMELNLLS